MSTLEASILALYTAAGWTTQLLLLARATDVDAASVGTWTDRSGTGWNATQGTGGAKPAYSDTSINSRPGLTFDGGDLLSTASRDLSAFTACVVHVVFLDTTAAASIVVERSANAAANNGGLYITVNESGNTVRFLGNQTAGTTSVDSTTQTMAAAHVVTGTWDQALATNEPEIRIDGANVVNARPSNANTSGGLGNHAMFIGARSGIVAGLAGTIGAVILATGTTAIPTTQVAAVEALLKAQWGTP